MLDRDAFFRPIAHRGLHNAKKAIVENTLPAFEAAIAKGYGIECDLRPAAGGLPIVFHDETLDRLVRGKGAVSKLEVRDLKTLSYKGCDTHILTYSDLLDLVGGKVPLLVEIKSEWNPPDRSFLSRVAKLSQSYKGPLALMSFDPDVMTMLRELAPKVPRGIVSGSYAGHGWWQKKLSKSRAHDLRDLLLSAPADPQFYAYQVGALPTPVTRYVREVCGLALFTWTVRTAKDRSKAARWADAPIFEGFEP
ncbi:MAG: glycerophosphodiester phosphodiesterase [Hyphomicrobiaceae bacterium]|nr:glycerophosphodiester phosphodiesterase [Hyphomicrobiaceae bacterium]